MFWSGIFIIFLYVGPDSTVTWGQELNVENVTDETLAEQWLQELDGSMANVGSEAMLALWNYQTNMTAENSRLSVEASIRAVQFGREVCKNVSRFDWKNFTDPSLIRRFQRISHCTRLRDDEFRLLSQLTRNMSAIYNKAEICKDDSGRGTGNDSCVQENPGLTTLMATSRDWNELLWAWESWRNVSVKQLKPLYVEMVSLVNKDSKLRGYEDFGDYWQSAFEMENFASACEDLWQQVKPLYQQLHAYVRRKLMDSYPQNVEDFPSSRHIPAHILGDIWAQSWESICDLVRPFPNSSAVNVTRILKDKGFNALQMFHEADLFFISLGLHAMPQEFWSHSLIEKPKDGRDVDCQPSAWDFRNKRDFRIKQCTEVTDRFFAASHHEMGHIQYYLNYKDQPLLYRNGANPGFQEAVGDVIALSVMTPEHLHKINLVNDTADDHESDMNFLMKQALEKVAFLPYGYLIDRWRWEVFNGTTTPENYNKKFWKLRCSLQGISPPVRRSEEDFDIATLFHIRNNAPYMSYFVAHIIQFQFQKSLCDAAGHVGPLHKCDIYNSTAAGDKLRAMLSLGSSKPWPDAMEIMTGQRKMDAQPLLDYFRPLQKWLENENKGQYVTWDEECPSGSIL